MNEQMKELEAKIEELEKALVEAKQSGRFLDEFGAVSSLFELKARMLSLRVKYVQALLGN